MSSFVWPSEDGWPYPDTDHEMVDVDTDFDDDAFMLHAAPAHLLDGLDGLERDVITARYGLDGRPARSLKQLHADLGLPRNDLRDALGSGLAKLRSQLL